MQRLEGLHPLAQTDLFLLEFELSFVEGGYAINSAAYIGILPRTVVPFIRANHGN